MSHVFLLCLCRMRCLIGILLEVSLLSSPDCLMKKIAVHMLVKCRQ
uniref:Uncharacterized protein n=1 Tax=Arundo donax TaxID=35708 RepID=A0A0A8ZF62_ARUDO